MINTIDIIKAILKNIERSGIKSAKDKENYFWKNHADTCNKYPFLVSHLCSGGDTKMLDLMIQKLKQIEEGEVSQNKADKEIGKVLSDKYLPN